MKRMKLSMNHFAVHLKLTHILNQLQFKIKKKKILFSKYSTLGSEFKDQGLNVSRFSLYMW